MQLTATKRFHASDIQGPDGRRTVNPGEQFDAPDETGRQLLDKGFATEAASLEQKSEPELLNKVEPTPRKKRKAGVDTDESEE